MVVAGELESGLGGDGVVKAEHVGAIGAAGVLEASGGGEPVFIEVETEVACGHAEGVEAAVGGVALGDGLEAVELDGAIGEALDAGGEVCGAVARRDFRK